MSVALSPEVKELQTKRSEVRDQLTCLASTLPFDKELADRLEAKITGITSQIHDLIKKP